MDDKDFQQMLDGLDKELSEGKVSPVLKLGPGKHVVKFRWPEGREAPQKFYESYEATFKGGKTAKYFLVPGIVVKSDVKEVPVDAEAITYLSLTKTQMIKVHALLTGDWPELLDVEGPLVDFRVVATGEIQREYTMDVLKVKDGKDLKVKRFDSSNSVYPEMSIDEAVEDQVSFGKRMQEKNTKDETLSFE